LKNSRLVGQRLNVVDHRSRAVPVAGVAQIAVRSAIAEVDDSVLLGFESHAAAKAYRLFEEWAE
jgi:hypothetical protein